MSEKVQVPDLSSKLDDILSPIDTDLLQALVSENVGHPDPDKPFIERLIFLDEGVEVRRRVRKTDDGEIIESRALQIEFDAETCIRYQTKIRYNEEPKPQEFVLMTIFEGEGPLEDHVHYIYVITTGELRPQNTHTHPHSESYWNIFGPQFVSNLDTWNQPDPTIIEFMKQGE